MAASRESVRPKHGTRKDQHKTITLEIANDVPDAMFRLKEQETTLHFLSDQALQWRQRSKDNITKMFAELKAILDRKESDNLCKINQQYESVQRDLRSSAMSSDERNTMISRINTAGNNDNNDKDTEQLRAILDEIENDILLSGRIIDRVQIPAIVHINPEMKTVIDNLMLDYTTGNARGNDTNVSTTRDETVVSGNTDVRTEVGATGAESELNVENIDEMTEVLDSVRMTNAGVSGRSDRGGNENTTCSVNRIAEDNISLESSHSVDYVYDERGLVPSVPVTDQFQDEGDSVEPPPPYWQAVGELESVESEQNIPVIGRRVDLVVRNSLWLVQSFLARKHTDRKTPVLTGLTRECHRILAADKANRSLKIFRETGELITTMFFADSEIQDIAFLGIAYDEVRYVITFPKSHTLMIMSIDSNNIPRIDCRIIVREQYATICRGVSEQTLIGSVIKPNHGYPRIDVFNLDGTIIHSVSNTPEGLPFAYPRSIAVAGDLIVVADYKLNMVCVFKDNGMPQGQYGGSPETSLHHPSSLTLDQFGNVLIMDGEHSNIHVMNLRCEPRGIIRVPKFGSDSSQPNVFAFDVGSKKLVMTSSNGHLAFFEFEGGYHSLRQEERLQSVIDDDPPPPEQLPRIAGILPSNIAALGRPSQRARTFHL